MTHHTCYSILAVVNAAEFDEFTGLLVAATVTVDTRMNITDTMAVNMALHAVSQETGIDLEVLDAYDVEAQIVETITGWRFITKITADDYRADLGD